MPQMKKIVIADDNKRICDVVKSILTDLGYEVDAVYNGYELLAYLENKEANGYDEHRRSLANDSHRSRID